MFHRKDKKTVSLSLKPVKDLTAVSIPAQLLSGDKRQTLLMRLKELSALDTTRFDTLCVSLIHQLTHYCQGLPETTNSYFARPGGILDYALNRAEVALQLFHQYLVQQENTPLSEMQKLWLYALLSACLLKDIGKLQIDYRVQVFDAQGQPLRLWNPLNESLTAAGSYYQFVFETDSEDKIPLRRQLNLLLAHILMPSKGFLWIASNPQVLAVWLALLSDDWRAAGTLGALLVRADAAAIQRYFNEFILI